MGLRPHIPVPLSRRGKGEFLSYEEILLNLTVFTKDHGFIIKFRFKKDCIFVEGAFKSLHAREKELFWTGFRLRKNSLRREFL